MCTTTTYFKSNGAIACGYDIPAGLNWNQAAAACASNGARLPEIADARENNELFLRKVKIESSVIPNPRTTSGPRGLLKWSENTILIHIISFVEHWDICRFRRSKKRLEALV